MRFVVATALLFLICLSASADGVVQTADAILAAVDDDEAMKALAANEQPDPWLLVSELCRRGENEAAAKFAEATEGPATERLAAYVASLKGEPESQELYDALIKARDAYKARKPEDAIAVLPLPRAPTNTIVGVMLAHSEAMIRHLQGRPGDAAEAYVAAAEGAESMGWLHRAGLCFTYAGRFHGQLGNSAKSTGYFERGLAAWDSIGFTLGVAVTLTEMAVVARNEHRTLDAIRYWERSLRLFDKVSSEKGLAPVLLKLGLAHYRVGNFQQALANYERALPLCKKYGLRADLAATLINMGNVYDSLADYRNAIEHHEKGLDEARAIGNDELVGNGLLNLAGVYWKIGNASRALVYTEKALDKMKSNGRAGASAHAMAGLGILRTDLGDYEGALQYLNAAHAQASVLEMKQLEATTLSNIARVHYIREDYVKALEFYEHARDAADEINDREVHARCIGAIGSVLLRQGKRKEGYEELRECERQARRLRARGLLVWCLSLLASAHLDDGDPSKAMFFAREARTEVGYLLGGLGGTASAQLRSKHADLFHTGALAAVRVGDTAEALTFLESGRAGRLLELLGGRHALRGRDLPEGLRRAEQEAELKESAARSEYQRAVSEGNLKKVRAAAHVLDAAEVRLSEVNEKIQRTASAKMATLFYPRAATLEELQGLLDAETAMVIYGVGDGQRGSLALVLTAETARVVELGNSDTLWKAGKAVRALSDLRVSPGDARERARARLVTPLALSKSVKRVLISPDYALCNLPFGLVFDRPVTLTPSGTTHSFLSRSGLDVGRGVLALGDPVYDGIKGVDVYAQRGGTDGRGGRLTPLPASGPEAKAVGDETLLGAKATKAELTKALAKRERWHAVHFACHGSLDPDPDLCALALSDGFLTRREVFRMDIATDLAVLSACETAQGKVMRGEGMVGLTRSFMYAGAPRVLCSLWKVDDEATMALMIKFYELWNPKDGSKGLSAAVALQKAQQHIKSQKKWAHPYYWAAWVLWGLPS